LAHRHRQRVAVESGPVQRYATLVGPEQTNLDGDPRGLFDLLLHEELTDDADPPPARVEDLAPEQSQTLSLTDHSASRAPTPFPVCTADGNRGTSKRRNTADLVGYEPERGPSTQHRWWAWQACTTPVRR